MLKKFIAAALLSTATVISGVSVMADTGISDLYYTVDGLDVNISGGLVYKDSEKAANVFVAVYDGGYLEKVKMFDIPADSSSIGLDDFTLTLDSAPTDLKVKAFLWSADGKCVPLADAVELSDLYGDKTVSFKCRYVADDDPRIGTSYVEIGKLPVYESGKSSKTTKYDLADDAVIYVNGVNAGRVENWKIVDYIIENSTGSLTLIDAADSGSTDGKYDYIMVDYYVDAVVDSVHTASEYPRIYFKTSQTAASMQWDPDDSDINITFSGDVTDYTELQEYDVLSIAYDVVNEGSNLSYLNYYDVKVSRNTVSGIVTSRDSKDNTVRINGEDYEVNTGIIDVMDFELSTKYTLYLDAFGYAAYMNEEEPDKDYGVIVAMYESEGKDQPMVRMITANGEIVDYECNDADEARLFYEYATGKYDYFDGMSFTKNDIRDRIIDGDTVCTYKLTSDGRLMFNKAIRGTGGRELEFKAISSKLGPYELADGVTRIIDMERYMNGDSEKVYTHSLKSFEDEAMYDAYLFDKNNNGCYRFAIVFGGMYAMRAESSMAIVQKVAGTKDVNGITCTELIVARDGQKDITILAEGDDIPAAEGSVIAYVVSPEGYVEAGKFYVMMDSGESYTSQMEALLDNRSFSDAIMNTERIDYGKYAGFATPSYASTTVKDVVLYYGIVYRKSDKTLDLFASETEVNGSMISCVDDVQSFYVADANQYVYDFSRNDDKVSIGSPTQSANIFKQAYCTADGEPDIDNDRNYVSWNAALDEDITPAMAVIKVVDNTVIDVMYYTTPYTAEEEPDDPAEQNYGVITGMYTKEGNDYPIVSMITADAEIVEYECSDENAAMNFYEYAIRGLDVSNDAYTFNKDDIRENIIAGRTVCTYELTDDDKFIFDRALSGAGGSGLEFRANISKLGSYSLDENVIKLIDMDKYMSASGGKVLPISLSILDDEAQYDAYLFDKSNNGYYRFAILFGGIHSVRAEASMAIVQKVTGTTTVNGTTCTELIVARDGQEDISVLAEGDDIPAAEGSVITYVVGPEGYVEDGCLYVMFNAGSTYRNQMTNLLDNYSNFSEAIMNTKLINGGRYDGFAAPAYGATSKNVVLYYGIVYRKTANNLELFTSAYDANGSNISAVNNARSFSIAGANQYVYNFSQMPDFRVSVGTQNQSNTIFNQSYCTADGSVDWGNDRNYVSWDMVLSENAAPTMALVKEVDGQVLDVMYFVAP